MTYNDSLQEGLRVTLFPPTDDKNIRILMKESEIQVVMKPIDDSLPTEYGSVEIKSNGHIIVCAHLSPKNDKRERHF